MRYFKIAPLMMSIAVFASDQVKELKFKQYHNRVVIFPPFHLCYERIKIEDLYVGVETFLFRSERDPILINTEFRMGHNFLFHQKDHLTPFGGVGYVKEFCEFQDGHFHQRHKPGIVYTTGGFLYTHEFNSIFNLGINGKILMGTPTSKKHFNWGSYVVGSQVSFPLIFRFGRKREWDFRLEPFNLYLKGTKASRDYSGCLVMFGYRF